MSDETMTLKMEAAPSIALGDTISMWETPRLPWWGRLAVRLGLRAKPEAELRQFQVTASAMGRPWQDWHSTQDEARP